MIKLFLCDVDATLTDGIYHTTENGVISKNFFTRDFHGLWMLDQAGVKICIITAATDDVIDYQRRRGAKYADLIKGSKNKLKSIEDTYGSKYTWAEIAFIGDDLFDMELLSIVGLRCCPSDAAEEIVEKFRNSQMHDTLVSHFPGGHGCVREFAEYVLDINKAKKQ